jgi:hypothetical protein
MKNQKLGLILGTLGVLLSALSIGPTAALLTAVFEEIGHPGRSAKRAATTATRRPALATLGRRGDQTRTCDSSSGS